MLQTFRKPEVPVERRRDFEKRELVDKMRELNARLRALDTKVTVKTGREYRGKLWEET